MTPEAAIDEAKRGALRPLYVLVGADHHRQAAVISAIRAAVLQGGTPGLNDDRFVAGDASAAAIVDTARTLPMLAKRRVVIVTQLERWEPKAGREGQKKSKKDAPLDVLAGYASAPAPEATVVLAADKLDKRRRLATVAMKGGFLVACDPLARRELPSWVAREVRQRGHAVGSAAADLLAELAGPELGGVADAVERVTLFVGAGAEVTVDAVTEVVLRVRPTMVWDLTDAIGARDLGKALTALHGVFGPDERHRLVGTLAWAARQLIRYDAALRAGASPDEAATKAGAYGGFKARKMAMQAKTSPARDLERWLERLAKVDLGLKGASKRPPQAIFEEAIVAMCRATRRAPARAAR